MQYIYESELDLQRPARETVWETLASVGDGNAHLLRVRVRSGGEEEPVVPEMLTVFE